MLPSKLRYASYGSVQYTVPKILYSLALKMMTSKITIYTVLNSSLSKFQE